MKWLNDPITNLPSVSLTMLLATFILVIASGGLEMFGLVKNTSLFGEMFYTTTALYFGRRLTIKGKLFTSEKAEEILEKVETKKE